MCGAMRAHHQLSSAPRLLVLPPHTAIRRVLEAGSVTIPPLTETNPHGKVAGFNCRLKVIASNVVCRLRYQFPSPNELGGA